MNLIRLLLRTSWATVFLAMLTGLLSGASITGIIALINTSLTTAKPITATLVWGFAGLCLLMLITNVTSQVLLARLAQGAIFDMRMLLSRRILASPLRQLEEIGAPRLLATLTDDIQSVSNAFFGFPSLCTNAAIVVSCLIYLGWLSRPVFIFLLGVLVLGIVSFLLLTNKATRYLTLAREEEDRLFKHFRAITEGIKELKLHRQRQKTFLSEDLQSTAAAFRHYNVTGLTIFSLGESWGLLELFIVIGLLIFTLPRLVDVEPSVLSSYAFVIIYLVLPLEALINSFPILSRASIALSKIESLGLSLATNSTESSGTAPPGIKPDWRRLEVLGVTHAYYQEREESSFILGPIDLTLNAGELIFLVGGNGSGKSTLAKLIVGLYAPETGEIRVDGKLITNQNRVWYRQHFSVVFSDFYLFDRFLGLSSDDIDSQARDYLIQLQLERKVQVKDGVLSTTALSQGQRKRLALLTAYLEDRPIYVFDEWASDQDPVFKKIFYTQLLPELKSRGKTVLVISHDDRYFYLADRLVKLEYGRLEYDKHLNN